MGAPGPDDRTGVPTGARQALGCAQPVRGGKETRLLVAVGVATASLAIPAGAAAGQTQFATFFTRFKLERSSSSSEFKGTIDSSKGKCVKGRKVKLLRKHNGNTKTLGHDKTNGDGKFEIKLSTGRPSNGKYYSKVKKKQFDNGKKTCLSVTSGSIKVSS